MKSVFVGLIASVSIAACTKASASPDGGWMPALHTIQEVTLSQPYSCSMSYQTSALFLSSFTKNQNGPDLLYNGRCASSRSDDGYIEGATAGDDFALIADLGDVPLENITAHLSFNTANQVGKEETFQRSMPVIEGHTYTVLEAKADVRALFVVKVMKYKKGGPMTIRYAVKGYQLQSTRQESPGWNWLAPSK